LFSELFSFFEHFIALVRAPLVRELEELNWRRKAEKLREALS